MEMIQVPGTQMEVSRIALGTWAIGGWMWGGTDEKDSVDTIHAALDKGINLVDTAPVYGFGRSEEIVGRALKEDGKRNKTYISTKCGLEWQEGKVFRNSLPARITAEVDASLKRLQTDVIDIYFIHWPDPNVPFEDTAEYLEKLKSQGKIRACAVSNYAPSQMDEFRKGADLAVCQPPYNMFERGIEKDVFPYCRENGIALMTYGALCRGLLSGKMTADREFTGDDLRKVDPKFRKPRFSSYLKAADRIGRLAEDHHGKRLLAAAVRWVLDMGTEIAIWGGRRPEQMEPVEEITGWHITDDFKQEVDRILKEEIKDPAGPEFMAPPAG